MIEKYGAMAALQFTADLTKPYTPQRFFDEVGKRKRGEEVMWDGRRAVDDTETDNRRRADIAQTHTHTHIRTETHSLTFSFSTAILMLFPTDEGAGRCDWDAL